MGPLRSVNGPLPVKPNRMRNSDILAFLWAFQ